MRSSLVCELLQRQTAIDEKSAAPEVGSLRSIRVVLRQTTFWAWLDVDPDLVRRVLSKHLQVELQLEDAFLTAQLIGGFNRKWRLPLPQVLATCMGSVLVFQDPGCDRELLDRLEVRGIGERRAEGFGRIVFNRQCVAKFTVTENTRSDRQPDIPTLSETPAHEIAKLMVTRMLKQRLDERLLATANTIEIDNPPSNAQISRLRSVVLEELYSTKPDPRKICQFLESIEARSSARRQFERSIIKGTPLLHPLPLLRLIDLVLAHAAKQRGEEN